MTAPSTTTEVGPRRIDAAFGAVGDRAVRFTRTRPNLVVGAAAAPTILSLAMGATGGAAFGLTLVGLLGSVTAAGAVRDGGPTPPALWWSVAATATIAVARAPLGSHDLWSYAFYGRMWSQYGVDPYRSVPAQFPHDVLDPVVRWRTTPSGYGPLFTAYSAGATRLAGDSLVALRLAFQGVAAAAVICCLGVLHRAGRTRALVLIALAPFVWIALVNGGHNDALVGAAVLGAAVAFDRRRWAWAGVLITCAGMIKLPGLVVAGPFLAILLTHRRWRDAAVLAAAPVAAVATSLVLLPASLSNASTATRDRISRASIWRPVQILSGLPGAVLTAAAMVLVLCTVGAIAWVRRRDQRSALGAGASTAAFGMGASYTLTWYQFWGFPALALSGDLAATAIVAARGSLMQASYQLTGTGPAAAVTAALLSSAAPVVLLVVFLARVLRRGHHRPVDTLPVPST